VTFASILADCYRRLRFQTTPATAVSDRIKAYCNESHRELLTLPGIERLRDDVLTVTTTANVARSGLPQAVARIRKIVDRTNNHVLTQVPLSELRSWDPAQAFTGGFPLQYAIAGYQPVQFQPAAATGLWAVSSSASDTTQKVFVEAVVTGGYPHIPVVAGTTLTGTTRVALGTRTDILEVAKVYLNLATTVGFISLFDAAAAGNELARIAPGQSAARYLAIEWFPVPTAAVVQTIDATRTIFDLVNDTDEPLLPPDFHYVIALGARMKEYELKDDARYSLARVEYLKGQNALRSWVLNDGDRIATLRPIPVRWSSLGPMYPAGS